MTAHSPPAADGSLSLPRVSVVIPNYNYAGPLELCLASLDAQTLRPYEVIVSDDASTDDSVEVARRFGCRVLRAERNAGVSAARNRGAAAARGDILFFLDSDQALSPDSLENAVRLLSADPGLGCVHGIIAAEPLVDDGPVEWYRTLHAHHWRLKGVGPTPTAYFAAAALPRRVFEEVGPFEPTLRDSEDVEYSERLSARYSIRLTDRIVAAHDEEHRLGRMLGEQFRRAQYLLPFAAAHRRRPGALRANSGFGMLAALFTVAVTPLAVLHAGLLALPVLGVAAFAMADPALLGFVRRKRGVGFLPLFVGLHLLVNVQIALGAATGWVRGRFDRDFGARAGRVSRPTVAADLAPLSDSSTADLPGTRTG
ncbi:glycosyltransferase family 2 protein [Streptomyces sp. ST2-7A]|uniref:glycosyltransferase family 2 protein n=1 Tax=Streptomyces sp. ST2-7A TaxID=2907214 RepID=UPI001F1ED153|nr:glycosyltransferase family 2 protein [Streptomyces sp. ST2-7A]MCE7079786.1 glycosyltransferase [Streptomyces sp. ST2-7A]